MEDRNLGTYLDNYYSGATGFVPNKFTVSITGEMVYGAFYDMFTYYSSTASSKMSYEERVEFDNWKTSHVSLNENDKTGTIEFKWACSDVEIPLGMLTTFNDSGFKFDTYKNIKYIMANGYDMNGSISMTIVDSWAGLWYQFFNALNNQNFTVSTLTAVDSMDMLNANITVYGCVSDPYGSNHAEFYELQNFEYNAIIPSGFGNLDSGYNKNSKRTFTTRFAIANPFHSSFAKGIAGLELVLDDDSGIINTDEQNSNLFENRNKMNNEFHDEEFLLKDDLENLMKVINGIH